MPLRFGPFRQDKQPPSGRRPPPDYTRGAAKYRVFVLVALVMFVLYIMFEARDPKHYEWMWKLDQGDARPAATAAKREIQVTEPAPRDRPAIPLTPAEIPGANHEHVSREAKDAEDSPPSLEEDLQARARRDGWERLFDRLPAEERESEHDRFSALLRASRSGETPDDEERARMTTLLGSLDQAWGEHWAEARAALANLPDEDQARWQTILGSLEAEWKTITLPALTSVAEGKPLDESDRSTLKGLQTLLDELAFDAVRDDTIPNRKAERFAWFRLFEALGGADPAELHKLSHGKVGFVQLLKQPKDYRGKVVTVRGTIELGYRVPAHKNVEGIQHYYIFWLRPAGKDDSPLVIYALETPPGFPEVLDKDPSDQKKNQLHAEVEIDGYLFKRMAYLSRKGTLTTPLLLARAPTLMQPPVQAATLPREKLPANGTLAMIVAGTAGFAILVAIFAYYSTRRPRRERELLEEPSPAELRSLAELDHGPREKEPAPPVSFPPPA